MHIFSSLFTLSLVILSGFVGTGRFSSLKEALLAKEVVLGLCTQLGIVLDYDKSNLTPKQEAIYLGMRIRTIVLKAFPTQKRIETRQTCLEEFLGQ